MKITFHERSLRVMIPKEPYEGFCDCLDWIEECRFPYRFISGVSATYYGIVFNDEDNFAAFKLRWFGE